MKKYITIIVTILGTLSLQAQDKAAASSSSAVPMITVNGKAMPYSEYAAYQKAQQALNDQAVAPVKSTTPVGYTQSAPAVQQPKSNNEIQAALKASQSNMEKKAQEMRANQELSNKSATAVKPVEENKVAIPELRKPVPGDLLYMAQEKKAAATNTDPSGKQSPANNVKPVENLKYINSGPVAVVVADLKPVTTTATAATGESVSAKMGLTVAPVTGAITPVENVATPAGVQAKIDNSKPVQIVEVPKSVAASKQPTEKPKN